MISKVIDRARGARGRRGLVPVYHAVGGPSLSGLHHLTLEHFQAQVESLQRHSRIVFVDELMERYRRGQSLEGLASITFDDGYRCLVDSVLPWLEERQIPSTLFLVTSLLDGAVFWRDQVRHLIEQDAVEDFLRFTQEPALQGLEPGRFYRFSKDPKGLPSERWRSLLNSYLGAEVVSGGALRANDLRPSRWLMVGNHTAEHDLLSSLSEESQARQIEKARQRLEDLPLEKSRLFAMPFGDEGSYTPVTLELVRELGYQGVLLAEGRLPKDFADSGGNLFVGHRFLPRSRATF